MSRIFNNYLVGSERESAIEEAYFDMIFSEYDTMYEMVSMKYNQMTKKAEYKVFSESGTYDDLEFYMSEADAEVTGEKKSILEKIASAITALINKIISGIKSIFGKTDPEQEVEVDSGILAAADEIKAKSQEIQNAIKDSNILKAALALGGIVGTGFVLKKTGVTQKVKAKVCQDNLGIISGLAEKLNGLNDKLKGFAAGGENPDESKKGFGFIRKVAGYLSQVVAGLSNALTGVVQKGEPENPNANKPLKVQKNIEAGQKNGVTQKKIGKFLYRIDRNTGEVTRTTNPNVAGDPVPENEIPNELKTLVQKTKGKAAITNAPQKEATPANNTANLKTTDENEKQRLVPDVDKKAPGVKIDPKTGKIFAVKSGKLAELKSEADIVPYIQGLVRPATLAKKIIAKANEVKESLGENINASVDTPSIDELAEIMTEANIDFVIEEVNEDEVIENIVESTSQSIFGYDLEDERIMQEAANFENELDKLLDFFSDDNE